MPGTGFNSLAPRVSPVRTAAAFTADNELGLVLCDATGAAITVTLPDAAKSFVNGFGDVITFKRLNAGNAVTLDGFGAQTIDGAATLVLGAQYAFATIQSDGSNWHVISS